MTSEPSNSPGFWGRISRRGKIIVIVDVVLLGVLAVIGAFVVASSQGDSRSPSVATPLPSSTPTSTPLPPFRTSHGLAWIVAACGGPMLIDDLPESPLPQARDSAVCLVPEGGASVLIGVYDDRSLLDRDVADVPGEHRYATRTDDAGNTWVFLVEGQDAAPLKTLERYGFQLQ